MAKGASLDSYVIFSWVQVGEEDRHIPLADSGSCCWTRRKLFGQS